MLEEWLVDSKNVGEFQKQFEEIKEDFQRQAATIIEDFSSLMRK